MSGRIVSESRVIKVGDVRVGELGTFLAASGAADAAERTAQHEADHRAEVEAAYRNGFADGEAAARDAGVAAVPDLVAAVARACDEHCAAVQARTAADAEQLADTAIAVAEWILEHELGAGRVDVVARIRAAVAQLVPNTTLVVRVAPDLAPDVREWARGRLAGGFPFEIVADPALRPGEARIDAGHGEADLTFAAALARVREVLDA